MKQLLSSLYYDAKRDLEQMRKTEMTITQRVAYERALVRLEFMKAIIDKCNIEAQ